MRLQRETNEERFASIYNAHLGAVVNYATRRIDHASAIDAAAETFSIAWRRLEDVPPEPQTLPWLYGVARRVLANQRRGDARRSALHDRLRQRWTEPVVDEHSMAELHPLCSALESLSPDDRDIVLLAGAEGLSSAEIANVSLLWRPWWLSSRPTMQSRLPPMTQTGETQQRYPLPETSSTALISLSY